MILWPYGYTATAVPSTMYAADHKAFVALGKRAGSLNGYAPMQASKLYISDGSQHDWSYHEQRIFAFTFEMGPGGDPNFYPLADRIGKLTTANRSAVLYLLEQADCPYGAAGLASTYCGASTTAMPMLITVRRGPILD